MSEYQDCVIAGAGVIGLAVAARLSKAGRDVLVLEANGIIGAETSSRNSEVLHAGIYYAPNSLKARTCVEGRARLVEFCERHAVSFRLCGKLIVAANERETENLANLRENAIACGASGIEHWSRARAVALEPELNCHTALWSPNTGIIDSHALMLALQGEAEDAGALFAFNAPIVSGTVSDQGVTLRVGGCEPLEIECRSFVNCAGLKAQEIAQSIEGFPERRIPKLHLAKGNYFSCTGHAPFSRLIYPAPSDAGLGIHLTLDLGNQHRFGPDVEWVSNVNYDVDASRGDTFYAAIRRYWPGLPDNSLSPSYSGVRPKLVGQTGAPADFLIQGPEMHGCAGIVNLFGIESPGLTGCLAIADEVASTLN